jgi:hypothetical protein
VIVVIGSPRLRGSGPLADVSGLASSIAIAAAAEGRPVETVGRLGDDPAGDAVLLALARRGVGHVAMLRDPARPTTVVPERVEPTEPDGAVDADAAPATPSPAAAPELDAADVDLALRYLPEIGVIVAVHLDTDVLTEAIAATDWAETSLIVVVPADAATPDGLPDGAVTLALADDDESSAGALVGRFAAALDRGEPPADAYDKLLAAAAG